MTLILNTKRGGSMNISNKVVRHLKAHPGIIEIIPEVLSKVNLPGDRSNFKCSPDKYYGQKYHFAGNIEESWKPETYLMPLRKYIDLEDQYEIINFYSRIWTLDAFYDNGELNMVFPFLLFTLPITGDNIYEFKLFLINNSNGCY